jgi:hypothetical protein
LSNEPGRRAGLHEALFRQVNEQIRSLSEEASDGDGTIAVICECGDADCTERLAARIGVRAHPRRQPPLRDRERA